MWAQCSKATAGAKKTGALRRPFDIACLPDFSGGQLLVTI